MYSLIAKPDLFDTRIALSPALWRESNLFVNQLEQYLINNPNLNASVFMSMGSNEVDKMKYAFDLTNDLLTKRAPANVNLKSIYMPGATHQTNHYLTACMGITFFFNKQ